MRELFWPCCRPYRYVGRNTIFEDLSCLRCACLARDLSPPSPRVLLCAQVESRVPGQTAEYSATEHRVSLFPGVCPVYRLAVCGLRFVGFVGFVFLVSLKPLSFGRRRHWRSNAEGPVPCSCCRLPTAVCGDRVFETTSPALRWLALFWSVCIYVTRVSLVCFFSSSFTVVRA